MLELPGTRASSSSPKSGRDTSPFSSQGSDRSGLPVPSSSTGSNGAPNSGSSMSPSHSLSWAEGVSAGLPGVSWVWLVMGTFLGGAARVTKRTTPLGFGVIGCRLGRFAGCILFLREFTRNPVQDDPLALKRGGELVPGLELPFFFESFV